LLRPLRTLFPLQRGREAAEVEVARLPHGGFDDVQDDQSGVESSCYSRDIVSSSPATFGEVDGEQDRIEPQHGGPPPFRSAGHPETSLDPCCHTSYAC